MKVYFPFFFFLFFGFLHFASCLPTTLTKTTTKNIPFEETEKYKEAKVLYEKQVELFNRTNPCKFSFECGPRESCVNFPKCEKTNDNKPCPRTACVPRPTCESTKMLCPRTAMCAEFKDTRLDVDEYPYNFSPQINIDGDSRKFNIGCLSQKVPSDGNICEENEELILDYQMFGSEPSCDIPKVNFALQKPDFKAPPKCVCKKGFVRSFEGDCILQNKCSNYKLASKIPRDDSSGATKKVPEMFTQKDKLLSRRTKFPNMNIATKKTTMKSMEIKVFDSTTMVPKKLSFKPKIRSRPNKASMNLKKGYDGNSEDSRINKIPKESSSTTLPPSNLKSKLLQQQRHQTNNK